MAQLEAGTLVQRTVQLADGAASLHPAGAPAELAVDAERLANTFGPEYRMLIIAVVALTHDPKLDDLALLEALASDAFYIGGIGSRRNNEARRMRLMDIGIYIGSKTPPELAVSVMAELLAVKTLSPCRATWPWRRPRMSEKFCTTQRMRWLAGCGRLSRVSPSQKIVGLRF